MLCPDDSPISSGELDFCHNRWRSLEFVTEHSSVPLVPNLPRSEHDELADGLPLDPGGA